MKKRKTPETPELHTSIGGVIGSSNHSNVFKTTSHPALGQAETFDGDEGEVLYGQGVSPSLACVLGHVDKRT